MSYFKIFSIALLSAILAGCGGSGTLPDPDAQETVAGGDDVYTDGAGSSDPYGGSAIEDEFAEGPENIIYFDFDSSEVRAADQDTVSRHAMQLTDNPGMSVRLEGHADERGSREYNIGLAERRAQAVRQMLLVQGVSASQIQTVSFGEERPQSMGSSEADYAQNRRVEFNYN